MTLGHPPEVVLARPRAGEPVGGEARHAHADVEPFRHSAEHVMRGAGDKEYRRPGQHDRRSCSRKLPHLLK